MIWITLLSSGSIVGNLDVAKFALKKLLELTPSDCFAKLLLEKFQVMFDQNPTEEVSYRLAELEREMEELGYVADRNHLLHEADEAEYDGAGLALTEIKAIAFGLYRHSTECL
ncbi:hypothetical protein CRYUN_Cryun11dG0108100 [Craigia yunnanensis]